MQSHVDYELASFKDLIALQKVILHCVRMHEVGLSNRFRQSVSLSST